MQVLVLFFCPLLLFTLVLSVSVSVTVPGCPFYSDSENNSLIFRSFSVNPRQCLMNIRGTKATHQSELWFYISSSSLSVWRAPGPFETFSFCMFAFAMRQRPTDWAFQIYYSVRLVHSLYYMCHAFSSFVPFSLWH